MQANPAVTDDLLQTLGKEILDRPYFINCCFIFDTSLATLAYACMTSWMVRFPIMMCNEMGIMNLYFSYYLGSWEMMPISQHEQEKHLYGYCNSDFPGSPLRTSFCLVKYPS
jgi:hypothetical protein